MIKRYCDCCQAEMIEANTPFNGSNGGRLAVLLERGNARLGVEVMHFMNGTANAGDVCKHCILDALYKLDDRARPA